MTVLLIDFPGNDALTVRLARRLQADVGRLDTRHFPDGETYVRLDCDVASRSIAFVCSLDRPDEKALGLLFAAEAARDLGAARVGLIAPYLAYMRQDRRFVPGEAVTSKTFARLISSAFDWMVTVDPHLHRRYSMAEIYTIPVGVCHAAANISDWIKNEISEPIVIGPDEESAQWVSAVAAAAGAPFTVLQKTRRGDRDVEITVRDIEQYRSRVPVLVDDIVSSGRTMEAAIKELRQSGFAAPTVVAVHGIFAEDSYDRLRAAGAGRIVSTNSVPHASNAIDLSEVITEAVQDQLAT